MSEAGAGSGYLEVWSAGGHRLEPLGGDRVSVGRAPSSDVTLDDATVSRLHAVLERYPGGWSVRDVGSANGTFVNGKRLAGERRLQPGDEISLGSARLVFRSRDADPQAPTAGQEEPPELTRRERDVLLALCRPLFGSQPFPQPLSLRELADTLFVSEAAVKQHLLRLYDKFGIHTGGDSRRVRLANEAVRRRAVSLADLRPSAD